MVTVELLILALTALEHGINIAPRLTELYNTARAEGRDISDAELAMLRDETNAKVSRAKEKLAAAAEEPD